VLANEKRPDNFVSATIEREYMGTHPFGMLAAGILGNSKDIVTHHHLHLNCELDKAQLKITLTLKFSTLKRFILVVSCASRLEVCYIMEMVTQHALRDWGIFESDGEEIVRRWYKRRWADSCDDLVEKIYKKLRENVQKRVEATASSLLEK
jgi:hypothetical protein